MARSPRMDAPGRFHHIFNRAARRQVLFADRSDYRYFLMLLACAVRRNELVIQSFCLAECASRAGNAARVAIDGMFPA